MDVDIEISGVKRLREWDIYGVLFNEDNDSVYSISTVSIQSETTLDSCWCLLEETVDSDSESE